ncbi:MAG TPA: flagellar protein FlgN [Pseudobacteroides sp.]|uniref:flagellar protein FlgN n=1 Tax=Pseudobacteroides sp. TaxID=1968840 RepID=UPI002F93B54E
MDSIFNELIVTLDQELDIYKEIFSTSTEKTAVIVDGKVSELEKIVQAEQKLIIKITQIENQREIIIYKMSKALKMKTDEINLTKLIEMTDGPLKDKLLERQEGLNKLICGLKELNDLNSKLIRNSLDYINFSLNLFADAGSQDNNYGIDGEKSSVKSESRFDFKI